jgi:hypothetical protein
MSYNSITIDQLRGTDTMGNHAWKYTPENNIVSYEASQMRSVIRGTKIESIVHEIIQEMGYNATQTVHNHDWDITVDLPHKPVRIEVKSAMMTTNKNSKHGQFMFQNIDTDHFDYIVFAFVHPHNGIVLKWQTLKGFQEWAWDKVRTELGKMSFTSRDNMTHRRVELFDMDDFPGNL